MKLVVTIRTKDRHAVVNVEINEVRLLGGGGGGKLLDLEEYLFMSCNILQQFL